MSQLDGICVITPCLNPGPYLERCIASVRAQGKSVLKHIVIDGGSTDGAVKLLKRCAQDMPNLVWKSEPDEGQSDALNKALALVDTEYFGWLNADDTYVPKKIHILLEVAAKTSGMKPAIVYGDYRITDRAGKIMAIRKQPSFSYFDCLYSYLTVHNGAAIFHTDRAKDVGGFDSSLRFAMDYDLILRLAARGNVVHVPDVISEFRRHDLSKTSTLRETCREETKVVRTKYSGRGTLLLSILYWWSKCRVLFRMTHEGCVWSRFFSTNIT